MMSNMVNDMNTCARVHTVIDMINNSAHVRTIIDMIKCTPLLV